MNDEDEAFEELSRRQGDWGMQGSRKHQIMRYAENVENKGTSMTDKEAMAMALDALETLMIERGSIYEKAIAALKEALAQPEQEPVAILNHAHGVHTFRNVKLKGLPDGEYLVYIHPPQRTWVGLTDEDIGDAYVAWDDTNGASFADFARAIEAKLKQKNGYAEENT
jgi:hypothetical protein